MEREVARKIRQHTALYCFIQALQFSALGLIIPILTLFFIDRGLDLAIIGIVMAVSSATILIMELPTGGMADSLGRKRLYLVARCIKIISFSFFLIIHSLAGFMLGAFLWGFSRALGSGTMGAWFVDEHKQISLEAPLQASLAKVNTAVLLSLGISTIFGGLLPDLAIELGLSFEAFGTYGINVLAAIFIEVVLIIVTLIFIREHRDRAATIEDAPGGWSLSSGLTKVPVILKDAVAMGFHDRSLTLLLVAGLGWGLGISGLEQLWQPRVESFIDPSMGKLIFGVLASGYFLSGAAGNLLSTKICKLFNDNYALVLFLSRLLMGLFFVLLIFQSSIPTFMVVYFVLFFQNGIAGSPEDALFHELVPDNRRSSLLSLRSLFLHAGGGLGSVGAGYLANNWGISSAWLPGALLLTASAFLFLGVKRTKVS